MLEPGELARAVRRRWYSCVWVVLACTGLLVGSVSAESSRARLVTIGSGSVGGVYFPAAGVLCRLLNQERLRHGLRCAVEVSDGSVDNTRDLLGGRVDLGIVQTDVQHDALMGIGRFEDTTDGAALRALFSLHAEPVTIVSRLDAAVMGFTDLVGKRVNVGEAGSGTFATTSMLMRAFGMSGSDLARQYNLSTAEAALALCENRIDAFVFVVGHPNATIQEASESCAVHFVSITGAPVDDLLRKHKFFSRAMIAPGTYVGQEEKIMSLGVRASVLATAALDDSIAYEMTRAVFSNAAALRELHPAFASLTPQQMIDGNTAPWHPGAARYLREIGLLTE